MIKNTAKKTAMLLAFLALTPVGNAAFAQSVTGTDPVPGPYRPSPTTTTTTTTASSASSIVSVLMAFLLAL